MAQADFDFIVFGATSFVGKILAAYMVDHYGVGGDIKWAAAARSQSKLDKLKASLGEKAADLELIIADAADEAALKEMVARTKVIISTVGPYALYGGPLVKVCAETGTDYCDLAGEVQWVRKMRVDHEDAAAQSGARIVSCCGFDSIPSDLGVHFLQSQAQERFGSMCVDVRMAVKAIKGGMSGGTAASLLNVVKEASGKPELRRELADPYSLCGSEHGFTVKQRNVTGAEYDKRFKRWMAPFIMAAINTRVVHRSNKLTDKSYGNDFRYDETMMMKSRAAAGLTAAGLGLFMVSAAFKLTRGFLEKFVVPKPGEGPSPKEQEEGFFDLRFIGDTPAGKRLTVKVTGDRDPGYGSTAKMLAETGICLARDLPRDVKPGGFWTPATAFGDRLIKRLVDNAGLTFEVMD